MVSHYPFHISCNNLCLCNIMGHPVICKNTLKSSIHIADTHLDNLHKWIPLLSSQFAGPAVGPPTSRCQLGRAIAPNHVVIQLQQHTGENKSTVWCSRFVPWQCTWARTLLCPASGRHRLVRGPWQSLFPGCRLCDRTASKIINCYMWSLFILRVCRLFPFLSIWNVTEAFFWPCCKVFKVKYMM